MISSDAIAVEPISDLRIAEDVFEVVPGADQDNASTCSTDWTTVSETPC